MQDCDVVAPCGQAADDFEIKLRGLEEIGEQDGDCRAPACLSELLEAT